VLSCVLTSHNKRILYCIVPRIRSLLSCSSADGGVRSLANVKPQLNGKTGNKGRSKHCHGSNAENTVVHASASNYYYYHEIVYKVFFLLFFAFNSLSNTSRCTCSPFVSRSSSTFPFHSLTVICYLLIFFYYVYAKHFVICLLNEY